MRERNATAPVQACGSKRYIAGTAAKALIPGGYWKMSQLRKT